MKSNRIKFHSPFPPADCVSRLSAAMDRQSTRPFVQADFYRSKPVVGSIDGYTFRLRKRINYRSSFQSWLTAEMSPAGTGTVIVGKFAMNGSVSAFMIVWFVMLGLFDGGSLFMMIGSLLRGSIYRSDGTSVFTQTSLMLLFGIGLVVFGRSLARDEAAFITRFLVTTLAIEASSPALDDAPNNLSNPSHPV